MKKSMLMLSLFLIASLMIAAALVSCGNEKETAQTTQTTAAPSTEQPGTTAPGVTTAAAITTAVITTTPVVTTTLAPVETFNNPLSSLDKNTWPSYGTGDPFVMRYDGMYYLYHSTYDPEIGIKCWSSYDLVNWKYEGICAKEALTKGAYAPEVTYINGTFYMVTSPAGNGHYLLTSKSPTGPFLAVTDNWGQSIDGHIFIDNDGKAYFYRANTGNIIALEMLSNKMQLGPAIETGATIDDGAGRWTEGPMVVYHDGYYYLTYTGNHIMNAAYRIDYAVSTKSPVHYVIAKNNPVLISTLLPTIGIGHSSSVKAPNLDAYYMVYHTLLGTLPNRDSRIDRIVFDGESMYVLGPTHETVQMPEMPEIYAFFDSLDDEAKFDGVFSISGGSMSLGKDATVLSKNELGGNVYTIEITTNNIENGAKAGAVFGYKDDSNYGKALFDTKNQKLLITFVVNGKKTEYSKDLVKVLNENYDFTAVHAIQIEKTGTEFTFYVDDRELLKCESELSGTKMGVITEGGKASFGYVGGTANTQGSSNKDFYKPVGSQNGLILASHCLERDVTVVKNSDGESSVTVAAGDTLTYRIMAGSEGIYDFAVSLKAEEKTEIEIYLDGELIGSLSYAKATKYKVLTVTDVPMAKGQHQFEIRIVSGAGETDNIKVLKTTEFNEVNETYTEKDSSQKYKDGVGMKIVNDKMVLSGFGKRLYGHADMNDYVLELEATTSATPTIGVAVRVQNPAESALIGGVMQKKLVIITTSEKSAREGKNWMQGYYIEFSSNMVTIYDCNYDANIVAKKACKINANTTYDVKVECVGATITVYLNGDKVLSYTDQTPWLHGFAGIRYSGSEVTYDNLKIKKFEK